MLVFGSRDTSDAWVDALKWWWLQVRGGLRHVKRLVIYLDNGPKNSGRRTQFLKRMVQFADWSGLEIRLVYYPPYHSKYTQRVRFWHKLLSGVRKCKLPTGKDLGTVSRGPVMRIITFTAEDRRALAHERYYHPEPRVQRKMEVLWLKSHGLTHDQIATYADVSRRTVQRYLDEYLEGRLPRLRRCQWHQPRSALVVHEDSLEEYFRRHPPRSAKQARAIIEQQTGIRRGFSQVRHFLKDRLGLRWRKTGAIPVPPSKTVEEHAREQAVFLQDKREPRLEEARRGQRQVYFVDAAHFVFAPFLGCLWCAARLFVRAASGRKRYNVLGALDAVTHRLIR